MSYLGKLIAKDGNRVVSGNCKGADQAYQRGANEVDPKKVKLFLPWKSYEASFLVSGNEVELKVSDEDVEIAAKHHPVYQYLKPGAKKFMDRNAAIVKDFDYVFAYLNHKALGHGGTGHGWRIAETLGIPRTDLSLLDLREKNLQEEAEKVYKKALESIGSK